jgi:hypothetical protein
LGPLVESDRLFRIHATNYHTSGTQPSGSGHNTGTLATGVGGADVAIRHVGYFRSVPGVPRCSGWLSASGIAPPKAAIALLAK